MSLTANTIDSFLYFVAERESIRTKKEVLKLPAPWTDDSILQKYRFCNVHRADDRVSRWVTKHLLVPFRDEDLWFVAACARYVNWPPTLARLLTLGLMAGDVRKFDSDAFGGCVDAIVASGQKAWTGAFLITARTLPKGEGKGHWIARCMLNPLKEKADAARAAVVEGSLEKVSKVLQSSYGWGTFMAGQVVADLSYVLPFKDTLTWAPVGPGSIRGLNRLHQRSLDKVIKEPQFIEELMVAHDVIRTEIGINDLTLHDVQNCMCEYDKLCRLMEGGRVRAGYTPETRFEV